MDTIGLHEHLQKRSYPNIAKDLPIWQCKRGQNFYYENYLPETWAQIQLKGKLYMYHVWKGFRDILKLIPAIGLLESWPLYSRTVQIYKLLTYPFIFLFEIGGKLKGIFLSILSATNRIQQNFEIGICKYQSLNLLKSS